MHIRSRSAALLALLLLCSLALAACGGDDDGSAAGSPTTATAAPEATYPVTVKGTDGKAVTLTAAPTKIVSLSPSATEDLFAIGAGKQVVAVDDQSNYPADAPKTKLSGFQPNVEAIGGYDPDLVVMSDASVAAELKSIKVPLLVLAAPDGIDGAYDQLRALGTATGHRVEATRVVATMKASIEKAVASVKPQTPPLTYYYELDQNLYTATSKTFIGSLFTLLGLDNVGDKADDGSGYPQLSAEYVVSADPDLVFLADTKCCKQDAQTIAKRTGWSGLTAIKDDHVVALDDDIASRWGPRVVDLLQTVAKEVQTVSASS